MTKKITLLITLMLSTLMVSAHDIEIKNADGKTIYYNYINNGTELAVTYRGDSYSSYSDEYQGNVVIPEEATYMNRTRKVTSIGGWAFYWCSDLTSVTIPNSVTSIGSSAFQLCSGLTSVTIGNSVTSIGNSAFSGCYRLTSVTIPNSVKSIGSGAFDDCSGLKKVIVKDITAWLRIEFGTGANPLIYARHLYSDEDKEITNLIIPNSVTSIGNGAFRYCSGLTSVTIGNSVTSIGSEAFSSCYGLTSVTIGNSVKSIGNEAFYYCSKLTSVTIGNSVTSIGNEAFYYCSKLTSVTFGNSVTSIGSSAFYSCSGLTSVTIPNSVTSIGSSAFYNCSKLTSVTIGNSVTSIGSSAFRGCSSLTSVTIGSGVTSIGSSAFDGVDIPTVVSLIENPSAINGKTSSYRTFSQNTFMNATLYVPKGTIEKYKATDGWKDFLFIEEGEGPGGDTPEPPIPEPQKCATPTINYENGKLKFSCDTEGATCQYSITDTDIKAGSGNEVQLTTTYKVTVYATKSGYENSDIATKEIEVSGGSTAKKGDVNEDGTVNGTDIQEVINIIVEGE